MKRPPLETVRAALCEVGRPDLADRMDVNAAGEIGLRTASWAELRDLQPLWEKVGEVLNIGVLCDACLFAGAGRRSSPACTETGACDPEVVAW